MPTTLTRSRTSTTERGAPEWPPHLEWTQLHAGSCPGSHQRGVDTSHARRAHRDPREQSELANEDRHQTKVSPHKPDVAPSLDRGYRGVGGCLPRVRNSETGTTPPRPHRAPRAAGAGWREEAACWSVTPALAHACAWSGEFRVLCPACASPYGSHRSARMWRRGRGANGV